MTRRSIFCRAGAALAVCVALLAPDVASGSEATSGLTPDLELVGEFASDKTPLVAGDGWFFASDDGTVIAVDAATGATRWERQLTAPPEWTEDDDFGLTGAGDVLLASWDWDVYDAAGSMTESPLVVQRVDPASGDVLWSVERRGETAGKLADVAGDVVLVRSTDGTISAYDVATGAARWVVTDTVFEAPDADEIVVLHTATADRVSGVDVATGEAVWTHQPDIADLGHDVIATGGRAYLTSPGRLVVLDAVTGEEAWRAEYDADLTVLTTIVPVGDDRVLAKGENAAGGYSVVLIGAGGDVETLWTGGDHILTGTTVVDDVAYIVIELSFDQLLAIGSDGSVTDRGLPDEGTQSFLLRGATVLQLDGTELRALDVPLLDERWHTELESSMELARIHLASDSAVVLGDRSLTSLAVFSAAGDG